MMISQEELRARFPALKSGFAYLENAGGSQVPIDVIDAMRDYMSNAYVQIGASYPQSQTTAKIIEDAHTFANTFVGGTRTGVTIIGPSTTQLLFMLAECYSRTLKGGDEVIIARSNHEANVTPWLWLERFGIVIKWWELNTETWLQDAASLEELMTERTKIVAVPHVSNILGVANDLHAIVRVAHAGGARVVVDGVAYAPHALPTVSESNADWYAYSTYKVFGPHMSALYGRRDAIESLMGPNHYFIPPLYIPAKFELGGPCHEGCAGLLGLARYLEYLTGQSDGSNRATMEAGFDRVKSAEMPLVGQFLIYLESRPQLRVIGPPTGVPGRVPTISFVHKSKSSAAIAEHVNRHNIGIRNGSMYSDRLIESLGIDPVDGVVRASFVHYNTEEEVQRLCEVLDEIVL